MFPIEAAIDLAAIQAFAKVAQAGSFTHAAEALHGQRAHLSHVVSPLERELGARLLERTMRSLSLTEVAQRVPRTHRRHGAPEFRPGRSVGTLPDSALTARRFGALTRALRAAPESATATASLPVNAIFVSARFFAPEVRAYIDLVREAFERTARSGTNRWTTRGAFLIPSSRRPA